MQPIMQSHMCFRDYMWGGVPNRCPFIVWLGPWSFGIAASAGVPLVIWLSLVFNQTKVVRFGMPHLHSEVTISAQRASSCADV